MATRLRFSTTANPFNPNNAGYTHGASTYRILVETESPPTTLANLAVTPDASDHLVAGDAAVAIYVSRPLAVQTFNSGDAFKLAVQCFEAHAGNNLQLQIAIAVIATNQTTVNATLRSKQAEGTEINTSLRNVFHSGTLSASYTCAEGEFLQVELSLVGTPTGSGGVQGHNGTMRFGTSGAGGDLPENDTETGTTFNPWIEFANTILFQEPRRARIIHQRAIQRASLW